MLNAVFASTEMALVAINKNKLEGQAKEGNKKSKMILDILKEPSNFLATIQVGITLGGFFASASAAIVISEHVNAVLKPMIPEVLW